MWAVWCSMFTLSAITGGLPLWLTDTGGTSDGVFLSPWSTRVSACSKIRANSMATPYSTRSRFPAKCQCPSSSWTWPDRPPSSANATIVSSCPDMHFLTLTDMRNVHDPSTMLWMAGKLLRYCIVMCPSFDNITYKSSRCNHFLFSI